MEKFAAEINIPSSNLGVRFYYANYDNVKVFNPNFANHHTLYLVPTVYSQKGNSFVDFEARESAIKKTIIPISQFIDKTDSNFTSKNLFIISATPNTSLLKVMLPDGSTTNVSTNQGDLCPPSTGCNTTLIAIDNNSPLKKY